MNLCSQPSSGDGDVVERCWMAEMFLQERNVWEQPDGAVPGEGRRWWSS